jgi:hypothetical protein
MTEIKKNRRDNRPLTERAPSYHPTLLNVRVISAANGLWQFQGQGRDDKRWFNRGPATDKPSALAGFGPLVAGLPLDDEAAQ